MLTDKIKPAFVCLNSPVYVVFSLKYPKAQLYADKLDAGLIKIKHDGTFERLLANY
jgi:hypothetical protein